MNQSKARPLCSLLVPSCTLRRSLSKLRIPNPGLFPQVGEHWAKDAVSSFVVNPLQNQVQDEVRITEALLDMPSKSYMLLDMTPLKEPHLRIRNSFETLLADHLVFSTSITPELVVWSESDDVELEHSPISSAGQLQFVRGTKAASRLGPSS